MDLIKKGISSSDMFSEPYRLNLNGQTAKKTVFGGILTLLCAVISVTIFFVLGKEMFNKSKPRLNSSQKVIDDGTVRLRDLGLFWGYYSLYAQLVSFDESFQKAVRMKATWLDFGQNEGQINLTHKRLFIERCKLSHFSDELAAVYATQKELIEVHYCINPTKYELNGEIFEEEIVIKKPYTQDLSKSIWISTGYCNEAEIDCDTSFVDREDFYVLTRMADFFIDGDDFSDPLKSTIKSKSLLVTKGISLLDYTTFGITRGDLDDGVVFESSRTIEFHSFSSNKMQIQITKGETRDMYDLILDVDNKLHTINRSYLKLQELVAQVAAFAKVIVVVLGIIGKMYNKFEIFGEISLELNKQKKSSSTAINQIDRGNSMSNCLRNKSEKKVNHSFFKFLKNTFFNNIAYFTEVSSALSVRNVIQVETKINQRKEETVVFKARQENR